MGWLTCFSASPVRQPDPPLKTKATAGVIGQDAALEKSDSAFGFDRTTLRPGPQSKDNDTVLQEEMLTYGNLVTSQYSQIDSQAGKAASLQKYGPPKPICNEARLENLKELGLLSKVSGDPQIQHIMHLMCTVFNTDSVLVALLGDDRVYVHDAINFKKGDFGWRMSLCAHTLSPANHQVMVVEDPQNDARFSHLPLIVHGKIRFYAGTPIVSTRGHRLGTLCFVSDKARKFDAEGSQMLINMGELITRELERDWMAQEAKSQSPRRQGDSADIVRAVECFNDAVMFIDTSQPKWQMLHLNTAAQTKLKLYDVSVNISDTSKPAMFWDIFKIVDSSLPPDSAPWEAFTETLKAGQNFRQQNVQFTVKHTSNGQSAPQFNLTFRCAATTNIDSNSAFVGAPASLPLTDSNHNFYFVTISLTHSSRNSNRSLISALTGRLIGSVPFTGVELGPLLGKGGYGSVFRGIKAGLESPADRQIVAIKVIESSASLRMADGVPLETSITRNAHHRNVVNTLDYAIVSKTAEGEPDARVSISQDTPRNKARNDTQVWMMLEYCDCGSLQEASEKGYFRENGALQLPLILAAAHDVASGMAFLQSKGIAHGDLTGGNVLLASDDACPAGVVAKVADFGLARNLNITSKIETRTYGTVSHMAPELLEKGIFSKATDVYSFGVLMWELWHGVRAWSSLTFAQIITAVVVNKKSLSFNADADGEYAGLSLRCMHIDPSQRPSFTQILAGLEKLQVQHRVK